VVHALHGVHVVAHVEHAVELVSTDNVGGSVDDGSSGWLARLPGVIRIIADHAGTSRHGDYSRVPVGHGLRHRRHHGVVVVDRVHVGVNGVWSEEILVDAEAVWVIRGRVSQWDSHIHGSVGLSIGEIVLDLVGRDIDGMEVAKCVRAGGSSRKRTVGQAVLEGLLLILCHLRLLIWHPEVGHELFEIFRVSVSNVLEKKSVLIGIEHVHAVVGALVHVVIHDDAHTVVRHVAVVDVAAVAIEDTGQRLVSDGIHVDMITTRFELIMAVVGIDYVHHRLVLFFGRFIV